MPGEVWTFGQQRSRRNSGQCVYVDAREIFEDVMDLFLNTALLKRKKKNWVRVCRGNRRKGHFEDNKVHGPFDSGQLIRGCNCAGDSTPYSLSPLTVLGLVRSLISSRWRWMSLTLSLSNPITLFNLTARPDLWKLKKPSVTKVRGAYDILCRPFHSDNPIQTTLESVH